MKEGGDYSDWRRIVRNKKGKDEWKSVSEKKRSAKDSSYTHLRNREIRKNNIATQRRFNTSVLLVDLVHVYF